MKAVLSDFDGTLVDHECNHNIHTPSLIKKLQDKNILFALATGRACFGEVERKIKELQLSEYNIMNGGSMIINWKTRETILHKPISQPSLTKVVNYLTKTKLIYSLETKDNAYMLEIVDTPAYTDVDVISKFTVETIPQNVLKVLIHGYANKLPESIIDIHIKNIAHLATDIEVVKFSFTHFFGLDVTSEESTKHTAVLEYAKFHGFSPKEIVAIGDGYNDYPLFTACGYRIAMGNAPKELKEIADLVVPTAQEGGMKQALEQILSLSIST